MASRFTARQVLERYALEEQPPTFFGMTLTDVNQTGPTGERPLDVAAIRGNLEEVYALLEGGADVDACDVMGQTALHSAVGGNYVEVVKALLEAGASPILKSKFNFTPMKIAEHNEHKDLIEILTAYLP